MKRVILIVLDSVGAGWLPDAARYGDEGASTLRHIIETEHPALPNLAALGLGLIPGVPYAAHPARAGLYGRAMEVSAGMDTTTGHWEMAGLRLDTPFPTFPGGFPAEFIAAFERAIGRGTLGNYASSGTVILDELGEEHLRTGKPIVYTSADSVFQIAAHEEVIPLDELYALCRTARAMLAGPLAVGRVIARPFVGTGKGQFQRTGHRRDFSLEPTGETLLDVLKAAGRDVIGVGKIEDIFCERGLTASNHAAGNPACVEATLAELEKDFNGLLFVNLVDFDSVYGHRNDAAGYARALEYFDQRLPEITARMGDDDLLLITADHGCDPCYPGTDHTREYIPLLGWRRALPALIDLGTRATYADIAATVAELFGLPQRFGATSFADQIKG